jgi:hypothetical protein
VWQAAARSADVVAAGFFAPGAVAVTELPAAICAVQAAFPAHRTAPMATLRAGLPSSRATAAAVPLRAVEHPAALQVA